MFINPRRSYFSHAVDLFERVTSSVNAVDVAVLGFNSFNESYISVQSHIFMRRSKQIYEVMATLYSLGRSKVTLNEWTDFDQFLMFKQAVLAGRC